MEEQRVGGCMDMSNGVKVLSFPEVETSESSNAEEVGDVVSATATDVDRGDVCIVFLQHTPVVSWQDVDDEVRFSPRVHALGDVSQHQITPNINLVRVAGDDHTNKYVIYDGVTETPACTDLFHGEYGDLDPVNTRMCRV
ncbi:hypothetical protein TraAM80_04864 [Trypanosoma rangeli]|uniref:Uncharacterized protein n=1 Tax=Trypanosoma rangeli TaxID=5698 RepID=A0A3R7MF32_TRYRA|nr:uncharacterized protein TraAM80_04864 [Trypanosoma rangeli]RNF04668.1 hypothetical protein TraAM80_04864 [Trypanosoma rangeli]|eukprot:RNF04668.1 hypothetical protein TraAM80_04864 [Trypanosoma rangeli]